LIEHNRGPLGPLANHPLRDPRAILHEGDVRTTLGTERWDAILLDIDNGPDAFNAKSNEAFYSDRGTRQLARALRPGGVLVVWSAYPDPGFERRLRRAGLEAGVRRVHARGSLRKGRKHTLFVGRRTGR
jgi:spermidine synthase